MNGMLAGSSSLRARLLALIATIALTACGPLTTAGTTGCTLGSFRTEQSGAEIGLGLLGSFGLSAAQSFQLTATSDLASVQIKLKRNGSFASNDTHTVTVSIYSGTSSPSTLVGTSDSLLVRNISSSGTYYTFTFSTPLTLGASTTYWIVATVDYGASSSNYISWSGNDSSATGYAGVALYKDPSSGNWTDTLIGGQRDLVFVLGC